MKKSNAAVLFFAFYGMIGTYRKKQELTETNTKEITFMEEKQSLFRKNSLERITSPEQLQDYMRVTNPGIWIVLAVIIVLLVGLIVCASVGKLETKKPVQAVVQDGELEVVIPKQAGYEVKKGMEVLAGDQKMKIDYVYEQDSGETTASADTKLPDGSYDAELVLESITPISFLLN